MTELLPRNLLVIEDRLRKDYGDVAELAASIKQYGVIQPPVVNAQNRLIAGGRRVAAMDQLGWTEIPIVRKETLSESHLAILEMEENLRRKQMDWKEECASILKIHSLKTDLAIAEGETWTAKHSATMLGVSRAQVGFVLTVAQELQRLDSPCHQCDGVWSAIKLIMRRNEDRAQAELARKIAQQTRDPVLKASAERPQVTVSDSAPFEENTQVILEPVPQHDRVTIDLTNTLIRADCISWMRAQPPGKFNHILTDPPYAIDMGMLNQQNPHGGMVDIERIEETHQVHDNLELLGDFLTEAYRITDDRAFCVLFCDPMRWQYLYDLATRVGWKVQRWPFIWHKTSACMNQAAQYNTTKNFEFAMICRKPGAVLKKVMSSSIFTCPNTGYVSNPFAKPSTLWFELIEAISLMGETILDPFMGEGSSTKACYSCHRKPTGVEVDEKHYNVALDSVRSLCDTIFRKPNYV